MEIKLGIGIGDIVFGIKPDEAQRILGKPDIKITDPEDENRLILTFNKQRIRLVFHKESDNKLAYIESSNSYITFNNYKVLGSNVEDIKENAFQEHIKEWEVEEYYSFNVHFNEEYWISLHSEFEFVAHIELGVPFKDDEEYNWPKL